ncbi:MAG: HTH-type transcriptional regulator RpiR [Candidatus Erwinia impunctatus]|nr:HTH-type transcriptional regulator RpiR [Culicoides impunctatus]
MSNQTAQRSQLPHGIGLAPWLRMKQEGMTQNESRIVDWLLTPGNLQEIHAIKEVAEALAVSEAMIVKVAKRLGFSGFRDLRGELVTYFSESEQVLPTELSFDEAPQDVVNKVFNITLRTIMEGMSIVNVDEIHRAARYFAQANQRDLYGVGGSNAICADIQHKFLRIGIRCHAYQDAHIMMVSDGVSRPAETR